ncbi:MAG TPA: glycosyltransferase N-terminal domain-containing protein [Thermoanaerobaculia bacterium]|nr:glycosyltransferase N-terminal domain-containing protein [Thermoanaerobaculia bacterium]
MQHNRRGMLFYRIFATGALLAYSPVALLRAVTGRRRPGDVRGRLGLFPYPDLAGGIWIHAVSVGEVAVAAALLAPLQRLAPDRRFGLSVTTEAGRHLARRVAPPGVAVFAFPFDLDLPVERALAGVRPGLVLLTETELWPLFLTRAAERGIPVALVNGRISQRSFPRYRMFRRWFGRVFDHVAIFVMQSDEDARRIEALGLPPSKIRVRGNVKYDLPPAPPFSDAERLTEAAAGRPVFVAASTDEGEEATIVAAAKGLAPRAFTAIAPRRPERFDEVARRIESAGLPLLRRSGRDRASADVYLLDTIGELAALYAHAKVAFIGGSLVARGGHNPIEAWAAGVPVIVGPHTENFREVTAKGEQLGIATRITRADELVDRVERELADPAALESRSIAARRFVSASRGAAEATARDVLPLLDRARGAAS